MRGGGKDALLCRFADPLQFGDRSMEQASPSSLQTLIPWLYLKTKFIFPSVEAGEQEKTDLRKGFFAFTCGFEEEIL